MLDIGNMTNIAFMLLPSLSVKYILYKTIAYNISAFVKNIGRLHWSSGVLARAGSDTGSAKCYPDVSQVRFMSGSGSSVKMAA